MINARRQLRTGRGGRPRTAPPLRPADLLRVGTSRPGPTERGLGIHAGWAESIMLHLRPDLVDMDHAHATIADTVAGYDHVGFTKTIRFGWLSTDFSESGVVGDPTGATATIGEVLFNDR